MLPEKVKRVLFEEAVSRCYDPSEQPLKRLESWVQNANSARKSTTPKSDAASNRFDKAEELITFYTFAPLVLSINKVGLTNRILGLAGVSAYEENVAFLGLERQFSPPKGYLKWLRSEVDNHPIRYIREKAKNHKPNQRLEANTHVDAYIETDKLLILFEVKFTSDISYETTFNPCRNQLARLIDVGLDLNEHNGKEVLVILVTPRKFFEKKSRLYYYKIQEYTDPDKIREDIDWRKVSQIRENVLAVKWISLEDLIEALYKDFAHEDKEEAIAFFKERKLI